MGRGKGGLHGKPLREDADVSGWKTVQYQLASVVPPGNPNWFTVRDFVQLLEQRGQLGDPRDAFVGALTWSSQILTRVGGEGSVAVQLLTAAQSGDSLRSADPALVRQVAALYEAAGEAARYAREVAAPLLNPLPVQDQTPHLPSTAPPTDAAADEAFLDGHESSRRTPDTGDRPIDQSDEAYFRLLAAAYIGSSDDSTGGEAVRRLNDLVDTWAAQEPSLPVLHQLLADPVVSVRLQAARSLLRRGGAPPPAIKTLHSLRHHELPVVAGTAQMALIANGISPTGTDAEGQ